MIKVLIVDDSAFMRKVVRDILGGIRDVELVGHATNGLEALELVEELHPDVVTLDLRMPELDGLGVLEALAASRSTARALVVTSDARDSEMALSALELGAVDVLYKPTSVASSRQYELRSALVRGVEIAALATNPWLSKGGEERVAVPDPAPRSSREALPTPSFSIIVLGSSTGGPRALTEIITRLPGDLRAPVAVVVHLPEGFTGPFAERLDASCALRVREAQDDLALEPGTVVIAKAGWHLTIVLDADGLGRCRLVSEPHSLHRPSVDVLFQSAALAFGRRTLGVVLTGMGEDGSIGARAIRDAHGRVLTESEETCVVYGMPRAVVEAGQSDGVVALYDLPQALVALL